MTGEIRAFVHQLERRLDPVDPVDVGETLEPVDHQLVAFIADDGVNRPHRADILAQATLGNFYLEPARRKAAVVQQLQELLLSQEFH